MTAVAPPRVCRASSSATLQVRHLDGGAFWVLELSGEADLATLDMLKEELAQMFAVKRQLLVIEMSKLAFCDVHSAHLIRTAQRTSPITLNGVTGPVKRVFELLDT